MKNNKQKKYPKIINHVHCVWVQINPDIPFRKNIGIGEELTGLTYRGVSMEDTKFMVFS